VFAHGGYAGEKLRTALSKISTLTLEIIKRSDAAKGFKLLRRLWVVKRTIAWLNRNRRAANDLKRTVRSATACLFLASVNQITRRIANSCNQAASL
jgi:transposase